MINGFEVKGAQDSFILRKPGTRSTEGYNRDQLVRLVKRHYTGKSHENNSATERKTLVRS